MSAALLWIKGNKWIAIAGAVLLAFGLYRGWLALHDHKVTVKEETKCQVVNDTATIEDLRRQVKELTDATTRYTVEIDLLHAQQLALPSHPIRLCIDTGPNVPTPGKAEAPASGVLPQVTVGPDIGPGLFADADLADSIVAQCRRATRSD